MKPSSRLAVLPFFSVLIKGNDVHSYVWIDIRTGVGVQLPVFKQTFHEAAASDVAPMTHLSVGLMASTTHITDVVTVLHSPLSTSPATQEIQGKA